MENNRDSQDLRSLRRRNKILSIVLGLICVAALILPMQGRVHQPYSFEAAAQIDPDEARAAYAETGDNADLYRLALALCRQQYLTGEGYDAAELCECGRELYRRAKAGALDLETIGNPEDTTAMIELLQDFGITPANS